MLRRQCLERIQLRRDDAHERVEPTHVPESATGVGALERARQLIELEENRLEPELTRLMHDDEEQLVRVLRRRSRTLQREQLVEREIGAVVDPPSSAWPAPRWLPFACRAGMRSKGRDLERHDVVDEHRLDREERLTDNDAGSASRSTRRNVAPSSYSGSPFGYTSPACVTPPNCES